MSLTLHTNQGDLKIELDCELSPKNCENFLALAAAGQYNNCTFHRSIPGFIVQGGDPTNTGKGGNSIYGEGIFIQDEYSVNGRTFETRGVVAMANSGPNTNASQFFITYAPVPDLQNKFVIVGHILQGWETLTKMEAVPTKGKKHVPVTPIQIEKVTIHANPFAR
jgi:peptidyl-prolyl cis-trans isomerase-like 3